MGADAGQLENEAVRQQTTISGVSANSVILPSVNEARSFVTRTSDGFRPRKRGDYEMPAFPRSRRSQVSAQRHVGEDRLMRLHFDLIVRVAMVINIMLVLLAIFGLWLAVQLTQLR